LPSHAQSPRATWPLASISGLPGGRAPLIETIPGDPKHVLATFLWRGGDEVKDVVLLAQPDGVAIVRDPRSHLQRLPSSDIWYRTHTLPIDAEFSYAFSVNLVAKPSSAAMLATIHPDPLNPLRYQVLTGPVRSIARMPDVPANPWAEDNGAPAGTFERRTITTGRLRTGSERQLWVYRTPGELRSPTVLLLLDGMTYATSVPTTRILDNLFAAHRIGPTIAVLVKDGAGDAWRTDMYFDDDFIAFLTDDLLPWIAREYHVTIQPPRTTIGGDSIAGLTAGFAALRRPDVFKHVLSQSGSFWLNNHDADNGEPEWLSRQFMHATRSDVTFWIDVGQMEIVANDGDRIFPPFVPGSTSLLAANRHLRDVLKVKGYKVRYVEGYGAHEPLRWTRELPDAVSAMLGGR
jgi:enterochelin esterase-like enzyme